VSASNRPAPTKDNRNSKMSKHLQYCI